MRSFILTVSVLFYGCQTYRPPVPITVTTVEQTVRRPALPVKQPLRMTAALGLGMGMSALVR